jgi:asparagine synthase (glutamine-hydrolysing)
MHVSDIDALLFKTFRALGVKYEVSIGAKIETILEILKSNNISEHYLAITNQWPVSPLLITNSVKNPFGTLINQSDPVDAMMQMDILTYLPDDILTKVDRAAMSVGLETRVPLLDHRIVEFAQRIPLNMKVRNGKTKWLIRKLVSSFIPGQIIDQPKRGFQLPLADYLRGPLREWADYTLSPSTIDKYGFLCADIVQKQWEAHKNGQRNMENNIWTILMFQKWLEESSMN